MDSSQSSKMSTKTLQKLGWKLLFLQLHFETSFVHDLAAGETLNNYDFNDEKTEKLFGFNVPEKFFFPEEQERNRKKLREVCQRQTPVLRDVYLPSGGSPTTLSTVHQCNISGSSKRKETSVGNFTETAIRPNYGQGQGTCTETTAGAGWSSMGTGTMTEFEGVSYASCGTSCDDLGISPVAPGGGGEGKQARVPKGLFRNCREVMDLLQDEEETNSLVELKEEEEEMPTKVKQAENRKPNQEPPLIEEFTLDRAMQLPSLRETQDTEADDLFERTFFAGRAAPPLSVSPRGEDAKMKENEILKKKMEEVKARVHGSKKSHSSFSSQMKTRGAEQTKTESSEKEEEFENDEELKKTLEEVKRIAEESKREHETLFSKIRTMRGGRLEPQDRSFLLMGGEEKSDKEEDKVDEKEKTEKGKSGKMLIEELD